METKVRYSYLAQQFDQTDDLWDQLKEFVKTGDFTLGKPLEEFEEKLQILLEQNMQLDYSGTDAIKLCLKAYDIGQGDDYNCGKYFRSNSWSYQRN